jgi:hypothetical protein
MTVTPTFAQDDADELTETFNAHDGSFTFQYPDSWRVTGSGSFVTMTSRNDDKFLVAQVYGPEFIETFAPDAADINEAMDGMIDSAVLSKLITGEPEFADFDGREVLVAEINTDNDEGLFIMATFTNGNYGAIKASADPGDFETFLPIIKAIVLTLDNGDEENIPQPTPTATSAPSTNNQTLDYYDGDWSEAIAELQDKEIIAVGGSLVFEEDRAFFSGQGSFFTPLASRSPYSDVVMAGELSYTPSDTTQLETCTLLARVQTDNTGFATSYLQVGIDNEGFAFWLDAYGTGVSDYDFGIISSNLESGGTYHILFIAQDDRLMIFIDGERIVNDQEITESTGTYGIALSGRAAGTSCEGENLWVYQSPTFTPGVCEISAGSTVNKRSGPGTTFDRAGQMDAGTIMEAIAQSEAPDGFIWWQLEDETWVRDDVINAQGDCLNIPEAEYFAT